MLRKKNNIVPQRIRRSVTQFREIRFNLAETITYYHYLFKGTVKYLRSQRLYIVHFFSSLLSSVLTTDNNKPNTKAHRKLSILIPETK